MNKEQFLSLHPILKASNSRVIWFESVNKIGRRGDVKSCYLLVSTPAIFVIVKRTFPSGMKVRKIIPLCELKSVTLTTDYIAFEGMKRQLVVSHEKINELAAIVVLMKNLIYGHTNFHASTHLKLVVQEIQVDFRTFSPISDRFISNCMTIDVSPLIDQINEVCRTLESDHKKMVFSPAVAASNLIGALISTLISDHEFKSLIIKDMNFATFFPHFSNLLKNSSSLESVVFYGTNFSDLSKIPIGFFEKESHAPLQSLSFIKCSMPNSNFRDLIIDISKMSSRILSIHLDDCSMIPFNLEAFFYSIFDSNSFRHIEKISLNLMEPANLVQLLSIQLMNCDWVLKHKSLHTLKITNSKIEADAILQGITIFETGLTHLCLSNTMFMQPIIEGTISSFQQLQIVDLSSSFFTPESLISFFRTIEKCPPQIHTINLNTIKMNDEQFKSLYGTMKSIRLVGIQSLIWDYNNVRPDSYENFCSFLLNQPDLIDLSISSVILNAENLNLSKLANVVEKLPLQRFVMKGNGQYSFGSEYQIILRSFLKKGTIRDLDIGGQMIADEGLVVMKDLIKLPLSTVFIHNTGCTNADILIQFLKLCRDSQVTTIHWPISDIKRVITKVGIQFRDQKLQKFSKLRKQLEQKLLDKEGEKEIPNRITRVRSGSISNTTLQQTPITESRLSVQINMEEATEREPQINEWLKECLGTNDSQNRDDPVVTLLNSLQNIV